MTVTEHWSGNSTIQFYLLDPSLNTEPLTNGSGLASLAGPLDSGLSSIPGVLGVHRYVDGSIMNDFFVE